MSYRYLIDANCFTQAFHQHYCFDICPGFWNWLDDQQGIGYVYSIDRVHEEITRFENDLSKWADMKKKSGFFIRTDNDMGVVEKYSEVNTYVQNADFTDAAKRKFQGSADPWLIAYALAQGFTVVSFEVHVKGQKKKVKIPALSEPLEFRCIGLHQVLRETHVKLVLEYEDNGDEYD